jgi:3-oxoisoapionate kinase
MRKAPRLLLSYYGDDFTGSTDVLEALTANGVPTALFLGIPSERLMARFGDVRALGIASTSRSQSPQWMERHLAPSLTWLKSLHAEICHYKTCSTFDSSPETGSIGKAIEIGRDIFLQRVVPIIVGVPELRRYTVFGHLFATYQGEIYRIDRHPVMSRHPVTPMAEADLRMHLSKQTDLPIGLVDITALKEPDYAAIAHDRLSAQNGAAIIDVADIETQQRAGDILWQNKTPEGLFTVGSSGVEYALIAHWEQEGLLRPKPLPYQYQCVERIAAVSGSLSPMTERQIAHAGQNGFEIIPVDASRFAGDRAESEINSAITKAEAALRKGLSPLVHTQGGSKHGTDTSDKSRVRQRIGPALGLILCRIIERNNVRRAVIAGGDTSGKACEELGIEALTMQAQLKGSPGAPLCLAHATAKAMDGLEIALKGGQLGAEDYFARVRDGS